VEGVLGAGTVDGTLRQYMVVDDKSMHRLPEGLSTLSAAAAMCTGGTAYQAFFEGPEKSRAKPGRTILTQGTGGISTFAIQVCS
jgi:NADPH:quinone reductase-like Zn-dependent oxidoreductase